LTSSDLGGLYLKCTNHKSLKNLLKFEFADKFTRYAGKGDEMCHEAGYDAYMTGVVFLILMKYREVG